MTKTILTITTITFVFIMACKNKTKSIDKISIDSMIHDTLNNTKMDSFENINKPTYTAPIDSQMLLNISYKVVKKYFVNNNFQKLDNPKIETAKKFNEIFGMATTMGNDGKPTEINFNKEYVITVILPETNIMTTISPVSLQKDKKGNLILTYKMEIGQKQSYSIRPFFLISVSNIETGNVILKKLK